MIPLICGIQNMTEMTPFTKQEQTCRHREQTGKVPRKPGVEWIGEVVGSNCYIYERINKVLLGSMAGTMFNIL